MLHRRFLHGDRGSESVRRRLNLPHRFRMTRKMMMIDSTASRNYSPRSSGRSRRPLDTAHIQSRRTAMTFQRHLIAATLTVAVALITPVWADSFTFSTGSADGRLGPLSQPASASKLETETADDFILTETTSISRATITGLIPLGTPLSSIHNVEIEVYRVFPKDSIDPPSGNVPSRMNSPGDVEFDSATPKGVWGTLPFRTGVLSQSFSVLNTVVTGIHKKPDNATLGEGPATGEEVQIIMTFDPPIILPSDHYFF